MEYPLVHRNRASDRRCKKNKALDVYESIMFGESLSGFRVRVFNATFNNISVISWWSVFWWRKTDDQEKPPTSSESLTIVSHHVYRVH